MAIRSHTIKDLADELQGYVGSSDIEACGTAAVRIVFDERFVDHLREMLAQGENSVDLLVLSVENAPLYTVIVADATESTRSIPSQSSPTSSDVD